MMSESVSCVKLFVLVVLFWSAPTNGTSCIANVLMAAQVLDQSPLATTRSTPKNE